MSCSVLMERTASSEWNWMSSSKFSISAFLENWKCEQMNSNQPHDGHQDDFFFLFFVVLCHILELNQKVILLAFYSVF